ncbi:MAG: hypothetical protein LBM93_03920 [Oscillospiraceae bacterium]|jgi:hypothetical protein|nr:hypothetical protein [Oscillospiraceae bacterium]
MANENTTNTTEVAAAEKQDVTKEIGTTVLSFLKYALDGILLFFSTIGKKFWRWFTMPKKSQSNSSFSEKTDTKIPIKKITETEETEKNSFNNPDVQSTSENISSYKRPAKGTPKIEITPNPKFIDVFPQIQFLRPTNLEQAQEIINKTIRNRDILQLNMGDVDTELASNILHYIFNIIKASPSVKYKSKEIFPENNTYLFYPLDVVEVQPISKCSQVSDSVNPKLIQLRYFRSESISKICDYMNKCIEHNALFLYDSSQMSKEELKKIDNSYKALNTVADLHSHKYKATRVSNEKIFFVAPEVYNVIEARDFTNTTDTFNLPRRDFFRK